MSKEQLAFDESLINQLENFLENLGDEECGQDPQARYKRIKETSQWTDSLLTSAGIQALSGMALSWPDPIVRLVLLEALPTYLPRTIIVDAIAKLAEDPDDYVCMTAMRICGDYNIQEIVPYLEKIVGLPSKTANNPGSPVGRGAAVVHIALMKIFSATENDFRAESFYRENGYRHHTLDRELKLDERVVQEFRQRSYPEMQLVSQGTSHIGLDRFEIPDASFKWAKAVPKRPMWLPDFYIDTHPVTNSEYDAFCEDAEDRPEMFSHPFHPESKTSFVRNTYGDTRFGSDHPVTGVDWYDAFAYANWAGKSLPSAYQWEKAARGLEESIWPWGNDWDPEMSQWGEKAFDQKIGSITDWRELLTAIDFAVPLNTTRAVLAEPASSYGVKGLVGNAWEFTSTDYDTGYGFSPASESRTQKAPSVVLKGGSWTSLPGLMFPSYWGQDAPFCRHNEIGFRCVVNLSPHAIQTDPEFHTNTALHY